MVGEGRRTRLIRVRVSPDEYEAVSRFCSSSGAPTLSDLVRSALWQTMRAQPATGDPAVMSELCTVNQTLLEMNDQIARLRHLIKRSSGGRGPARNND
ncbi:MAG TPA: hypothetical protein VN428_21395 [Bryobacteraceae bacterium]|nr:hypothetical protein [Bryobacteraceae bacterium]